MKQEYKEKLQLAWDMLDYNDELSIEDNEKCFDIAYNTLNELVGTKDQEVLESLLEFFCEDHEDYGGICEHLKCEIGANFTLDQLLQAFYKKFDYLAEHDVSRLVQFSFWFFGNDMLPEFREMFNCVRSDHSLKYLDELDDWCSDGYRQEERYILREDMNNWQSLDSSSQ